MDKIPLGEGKKIMVSFRIEVRGKTIKSGIGSERSAFDFITKLTLRADRRVARIVREAPPTPIPKGGGFQVFTIDRGGGRTPKTLQVQRTFGTRAEAERFLQENRAGFGRETPVGVRQAPTTPRPGSFQFGGRTIQGEFVGPPPSERGRKLQSRRLELEKITKKVAVTGGQVDLSRLSSGERARVRQITGVKAEKAFTVAAPKATTSEEFQRSLIARQKEVELKERIKVLGAKVEAAKIKSITATTREEFATRLFERQGFTVTERPDGLSAVKPGEQIVVTSGVTLTAKGTVTGKKLQFRPSFPIAKPKPQGKIISAIGRRLELLFPKSPAFTEKLQANLLLIAGAPIISVGVPLAIGGALALIPEPITTVAGIGLIGLTVKSFIGATSKEKQVLTADILTDLPFFFLGGKLARGGRKVFTRFRPSFRKTDVLSLGEKVVKGVPLKEGEVELGLIPPKKGGVTIDIDKFLAQIDIPFKNKPTLPKVTATQARILEVIKEEPAIVTGSFAQEALLKKSRGFADLDIVTKDISGLASKIKTKLGDKVRIETVTITDSPLGTFNIKRIIDVRTKKVLADIDPLKFAEEGFVKGGTLVDVNFPISTVGGVRLAPLEARLAGKLAQLARRKATSKVVTDIELLTGGTQNIQQRLASPLIRGGFGFTRAEQAAFIGKTGPVTTSARDLFGLISKKEVTITEPGLN